MSFVHLHTHSHYSLLDGLATIDNLVAKAKEYKMPALALTDHGVLYGAIEFYKKCLEAGIKPIIGCEVYIAARKHTDKDPEKDRKRFHLTLLAQNLIGYKNLLKIVSEAHLNGFYYKPRIDKTFLKTHAEGLICLSGCPSAEIARSLQADNYQKAKILANEYINIFGEKNFYFEIQPHPELEIQKITNIGVIKLSKELNIPLVATGDIHYVNREDVDVHEVLLKINTAKDSNEEGFSLKQVDLSMWSPDEMLEHYKNLPEAVANTIKIAQRCNLELELGKTILPQFPLPEKEKSAISYLRKLVNQGLKKRYPSNGKQALKQMEYELEVIEKTGFADYFLIVSDFVTWAKNQGIPVGPGRGSAAGSIVSYILNITDLDPLRYGLIFERFLNLDRIAPPDIDLDFADDRRDEVIEYITSRYGNDHVAQIVTFGVMKARLAIRDVTRALGQLYSLGDTIAKLIPFGNDLEEALKNVDELINIYNAQPEAKKVIDTAMRLEGVARHASTHAAGVVISREPLVEYVPLQQSTTTKDAVTTQYPMYDIEAIGLLKMDILGLANLSIIKNAQRIIRKVFNQDIDVRTQSLDDKQTYKLLSAGETIGVFQLESDGMRRYISQLKPTNIEEIMAMISLYRPGPMELIPDYIARKNGKQHISYLHPKLETILTNTYGIAVYQEQVLQIARDIAGFSLAQADVLRKAIGKKIKKLLIEQRKKFIEGAINQGVEKGIAEKLFDFTEPFARYGFNRAHAASYALIAYWTAYLKAHFPAPFMAALLTSEASKNKVERLGFIIKEAKRMGLTVLAPEINSSFVEFGVVSDNTMHIRFGLGAVKNVGEKAAQAIVDERSANGPFNSFEDFLNRMPSESSNKKVIESLAKSGGFDSFVKRSEVLSGIDSIIKYSQQKSKKNLLAQASLFGADQKIELFHLTLPEVEEVSDMQKSAWEKEYLGIFVSSHPLEKLAPLLDGGGHAIAHLEKNNSDSVSVAGVISNVQKITTKSGEPMVFATIEDLSAHTEVLVFPKILALTQALWIPGSIVFVNGKISTKDDEIKIIASSAQAVPDKNSLPQPKKFIVRLPPSSDKSLLLKLKDCLEQHTGGVPVILMMPVNGSIKHVYTKTGVSVSSDLINGLATIVSPDSIEIVR